MAAYGGAATIAHMWAMKDSQKFASFASTGDLAPISEQYIQETGELPTQLASVKMGELPMPVWFFVSKLDANTQAILNQWNAQNQVSEEKFSTGIATGVYMARTNSTDSLINEQNFLAQTRYSVVTDLEAVTTETTHTVWQFLSSVIRPVGFANNSLRAARSVEEWGAKIRHLDEI